MRCAPLRSVAASVLLGCRGDHAPPPGRPEPLTAEDFTRIAAGGIDDRRNSYPWAVATFDGDRDGEEELYVGTMGNALCLQLPLSADALLGVPPARWQCDTTHWAPGGDWTSYFVDNAVEARVYRGVPDGAGGFDWERVFEPSMLQTTGFRGATVFDGALYLAGQGLTGGAVLWRTTDGLTWTEASDGGVVSEHARVTSSVRALTAMDGRLYVASASSSFVYASDDPAPGRWEVVNDEGMVASGAETADAVVASGTSPGGSSPTTLIVANANFGFFAPAGLVIHLVAGAGAGQVRDVAGIEGEVVTIVGTWETVPDETTAYEIVRPDAPVNGPFWDMAVFEGRLYAAPLNLAGGELWYAEAPAPGAWTRVIRGGAGQPDTQGFMDLTVHGDRLYLGTVVYPPLVDDLLGLVATEILRVDPSGAVDLLVGETRDPGTAEEVAPRSGLGPGFDYGGNLYAWEAVSYRGVYYVGTFDAATLVLDPLEALFPGGLPPELEVEVAAGLSADRERWRGFDLYATVDGEHWTPVSLDGLGNRDSYGVRALVETPWGLLLGAANPIDGFELWLAPPSGEPRADTRG